MYILNYMYNIIACNYILSFSYFQLFLNYMMFLKRMAVESDLKVIESKQNTLTPQHLKDVKKVTLNL